MIRSDPSFELESYLPFVRDELASFGFEMSVERIQKTKEIDTDPPPGATYETRHRLEPIAYAVRLYDPPSLFAGKMHALLCRNWKNRVKGRDFFDYIWFLSNDISLNLVHLEERMRQSRHWSGVGNSSWKYPAVISSPSLSWPA